MMKKYLLILCAVALALVSCNKQLTPADGGTGAATPVVFELSATHPDGEATKAVKTTWETGDVIFVFFSGDTAPKAYLEMKWDGSKFVNTAKNSLALKNGDTGVMTAVFLPFGSDATVTADNSGNYSFKETYYSYYLTAQLSYEVAEGKVTGTFEMQIPVGYVQFFLNEDNPDPESQIELRESHLTPQGIASINASTGEITHTAAALGAPLPGYVYDKETKDTGEKKGYLFSGILAASARSTATDYLFTLLPNGFAGNYLTKSANKTLYSNATTGRAVLLPNDGWNVITTHKPVDLGVEVNGKRIYWSSCNVGATTETGYGNYYAWGELTTKEDGQYIWSTYRFGTQNNLTKYNASDNKTVLDAADDVVKVNLQGNRRMPTKEEWAALMEQCELTWTTKNGVNGCLVTGKGDFADNSIFLPAAGGKYTQDEQPGTLCAYWSSTLNVEDRNNAWRFGFNENMRSLYSHYRSSGLPIRPVME